MTMAFARGSVSQEIFRPRVKPTRGRNDGFDADSPCPIRTVLDRATSTHQVDLNARATMPEVSDTPSPDQAMKAFRVARNYYNLQQFERAKVAIQAAILADPANAEYRYLLAMIQYQLRQPEQAEQNVVEAVGLERERPIAAWGGAMERYQGEARVWLENMRSKARKATP
jgi:tetratricopeptide (TPR) repeat protein